MLAATARAVSRRARAHTPALQAAAAPFSAAGAGGASADDGVPPDAVRAAAGAVAAAASTTPAAALTGPRAIPPGPPPSTLASREITDGAQAFKGDLRAASALGLGDGITSHTAKWLQADAPAAGVTAPPAHLIAASPPIKVHGAVVASTGVDGDPALGCPVEYIDLRGTSAAKPAVCKYTGLRYYSDDWMHAH